MRRSITSLITCAALALPAGIMASAPSALAAPHGGIVPRVDFTTNTSHIWSGWMDLSNTNVQLRFVAADFTVPTVKCNSVGQSAAFWVGLDGWTDNTVEQDGVDVVCIQGPGGPIPQYYTFYEMVPESPVGFFGVSPGDHINASVFYDSSIAEYNLVVTDSADSSVNINLDKNCPSGHTCRNNSAEVIAEDPGGVPNPLGDFGTVSFSHIAVTSADGTHGTLEGNSLWSSHEIILENAGHMVMAQPSGRLNGATAFTDTFKSAG